jgi:hypothetical protein
MKTKTKSKKGELDQIVRIIMWIVFFLILLGGIYFMIKNLNL